MSLSNLLTIILDFKIIRNHTVTITVDLKIIGYVRTDVEKEKNRNQID